MNRIGFFLYPGHEILDLAGPLGAFHAANKLFSHQIYDPTVISENGGAVLSSSGTEIFTSPFQNMELDTVVFVGGDIEPMQLPNLIGAATQLAEQTERVASVCTGAFLLAATGFLDGKRVTTHWKLATELQQCHPSIKVEADRIFINDGNAWTSAGVTAGIDLALALIEVDHGVTLAKQVGCELVIPYRRSGGQSQFSAMSKMEPESDRIRMALRFAREHLAEPLSVERLADAARLSVRQFGRAFRRETGETPAKAVERLRVEAARVRLKDGSEPIEVIARSVGFSDPERMRRAFIKFHGHPPQSIRRTSRNDSAV
jgi:transcriptional regulator GlxA family with amidase domain